MESKLQSRAFKNLSTIDLRLLTEQFLKLKYHKDFHLLRNTLRMGEYASNTYALLLSSNKTLSASECSFITKHPRTKTHGVLKWLEENGFIEGIGTRPVRFRALPLKKALTNFIKREKQQIVEKEKNLKQIIEAIESQRR